ncbi:PAAR domain-containing protein [Paraburkholderia bannensis]|uniref:PAAR domain-containing protein n=1 Tax=Paraburkholderia bannensis TaxID=765414 RepID=UPI002AC36EFF|nr:PAAR domain-containing protein [Paraburkholderia bannensis]
MRRKMIVEGDKTTKDGVVVTGDATMTSGGRPLAYVGAEVSCPACNSTGKIANVMPYMPMTFCSGKQVALENDVCLCKCDPPPKLIASQSDMVMLLESDALAKMGYSASGQKLPSDQQPKYIEFNVTDQGRLYGIRCVAYFDDGSTASGYFDHENTVRFDNPSGSACKLLSFESQDVVKTTFAEGFLRSLAA